MALFNLAVKLIRKKRNFSKRIMTDDSGLSVLPAFAAAVLDELS